MLLIVLGMGFVVSRINGFRKEGEEGARIWFYDQSEKRLYEVPRDTIPPDKGIGGPAGDGVRAVVITFPGEQSDPGKRRVAYLETFTPEFKELQERVRAARVSGRTFDGHVPARESDYFQTNSLVKLPEESEWHAISSPEGRRIISAWRSMSGPDGQHPLVCVPR